MKRADLTEKILDIKRAKEWTWKHVCGEIGGFSPMLIVSALLVLLLMSQIDRGTAYSFLAASALLPITAMAQLRASVLQGLKHVARAQAPSPASATCGRSHTTTAAAPSGCACVCASPSD